jgi:hypothetical protein
MQMNGNLKTTASGQDRGIASKDADRIRAANVSAHVRRILVDAGLSLSDLNSLSAIESDANPVSRFPHTFFSTLKKGVSPHLCQVAALSNLTKFFSLTGLLSSDLTSRPSPAFR